MNKIIFKVLDKYKRYAVRRNTKKYLRLTRATKHEIHYNYSNPAYADGDLLNKLIYKNENWEVVKNRFHDRFLKFFNFKVNTIDNQCSDIKTTIKGNTLLFNSSGLTDDWIYFSLHDYSLSDYNLSFEAAFYSTFREIQFGFRYIDFYNRYRFRIEKDCLHFDIVSKGQFYNSLYKEPFQLTPEEIYTINIIVKGSNYSFVCNNNVVMTISDNLNLFKYGGVALILWDDSGSSNIHGVFTNVQLDNICRA